VDINPAMVDYACGKAREAGGGLFVIQGAAANLLAILEKV
jgi:hypothetical protein